MSGELSAAVYTLHPGDIAVADAGEVLETLLGSCVALILADPRRTVGAMCHIVHSMAPPTRAGRDTAYAGPALQAMFGMLRARAIEPLRCVGWLYGGGNMFPALATGASHVGSLNVLRVRDSVLESGITLLHEDVGGSVYRRLRWRVGDGEPEVRAVAIEE